MTYAIVAIALVALVVGVVAYDRHRTKRTKQALAQGGQVSGPVTGQQHRDASTNYGAITRQSDGTRNQTGGAGSL